MNSGYTEGFWEYQTELYKDRNFVRKVTFQDRLAAILILCSSFCHSSAYLPPDEVQYELPLLDGCHRPQKIRCKIRGKCCKSGVKWAKVGPAGWKEPLSASALLPCQLLNPLPHTLFNFQLEATPKKSAEEFCKFLSLLVIQYVQLSVGQELNWNFGDIILCSRVCFDFFCPTFEDYAFSFQEFEWWALVQSDFQDISHSFDEHARETEGSEGLSKVGKMRFF